MSKAANDLSETVSVGPFPSSASVHAAMRASGADVRVLGSTIFGEEVLCAEAGGDVLPPVLITAGCHAVEAGGVMAAVRLISELRTEHKVYVIALRDPFAFNDFSHCTSRLLGVDVTIRTHQDAISLMRSHGQALREEADLWLGLVGEHAVALLDTTDPFGYQVLMLRLTDLLAAHPKLREALLLRRVFIPSLMPAIEGSGRYGRTFTNVVDTRGRLANLSRFYGEEFAPPEVKFVEDLMLEVRPGITIDCHEDASEGFYTPARKWAGDPAGSELIGNAMVDAVERAGYPVADFDEFVNGTARHYRPFFPPYHTPGGRPGLFWTDGLKRDISIMSDFALKFGFSNPTETSMRRPLVERADAAVRAVSAGVRAFEGRARSAAGRP